MSHGEKYIQAIQLTDDVARRCSTPERSAGGQPTGNVHRRTPASVKQPPGYQRSLAGAHGSHAAQLSISWLADHVRQLPAVSTSACRVQ